MTRKKHLVLSIVIILLSLMTPSLTLAAGLTDPAEMEAFFDGEIQPAIDEQHIAGVAIAIVKDGDILFTKGYGYADVAAGTPVDPETTIFRIGSVSKLLTWTAVMQLAEQDKLDLDADINVWLDFEIPATYPEPITMKHLLSHTAGFEERSFEWNAKTPEELVPLGEWLRTHIPARVHPVGTIPSYSNYGASLAGYIVAQVSEMRYEDYVARYIFQPLGMTRTSAYQPLPTDLAVDKAQGYLYQNNKYTPLPFETYNTVPAGASSATATDIARFMIAHLQGGTPSKDGNYDGARILESATTQQMHSRLFTNDERFNGMAYGFTEMDQNGQRIIGHGGDTSAFHAELALLTEQGIGFFAVCNSATCTGFPNSLFEDFIAHYYPATTEAPTPLTDTATRAALIEGTYRSTRSTYTTGEKIANLLTNLTFKVSDEGLLTIVNKESTFVEVEPFIFRQTNGSLTLRFRCDGQSPATHLFFSDSPPVARERTPASENPSLHFAIVGVSLVLFLSFLIGGLVNFLVRRKRGKEAHPQLARIARGVLAGTAGVSIFFLLLSAALFTFKQIALIPLYGLAPVVFGLMIVLALAVSGFTFLAWKNGYWNLFGRIHYAAVTLAVWAIVWFAQYWHLMRW